MKTNILQASRLDRRKLIISWDYLSGPYVGRSSPLAPPLSHDYFI
jgi:hypothetical protein